MDWRDATSSATFRSSPRPRAEGDRLAALGEPLAVIRGVGDAFSALDGELERLARPRLEAVQALRREGWSCDRIASATGLSKGQVAQLARDPRGRR